MKPDKPSPAALAPTPARPEPRPTRPAGPRPHIRTGVRAGNGVSEVYWN